MRARKVVKLLAKAAPGSRATGRPKSPQLVAAWIGLDVVDAASAGSWEAVTPVLAVSEELLASGDETAVEIVTAGLVEGMHHAVSHVDDPSVAHGMLARLPSRCAAAWADVHDRVLRVGEWMRRTHQTIQTADAVGPLTDPDLARLFRVNYWRGPDGGLVGVADVADHEADLDALRRRGYS